ncbi:MAG: right-handed parallel beta-helix repeat-containing protein [Planctomycetota bacterium]
MATPTPPAAIRSSVRRALAPLAPVLVVLGFALGRALGGTLGWALPLAAAACGSTSGNRDQSQSRPPARRDHGVKGDRGTAASPPAGSAAGSRVPDADSAVLAAAATAPPDADFAPAWAALAPARTVGHVFDPTRSEVDNGALLRAAVARLQPGDRLEVGPGRYSVAARFGIALAGRADAPIRIVGTGGAVLTRPDSSQNTVDFDFARFVTLQGFEIVGGDTALKMYDCGDLWIDRCHVHHCGGVGLAANSSDTARLWITRNEVHDTSGQGGEGMYLGANHGEFVTHHSVVAQNHVYRCGGSQGDGIELKQGSYANRIVANEVHDTNYPCILVYGTAGREVNVIERNVCYRSGDNVMQVQGEAIVRNNLLCAGGGAGFASHDHQGQTRDLVVVHNTILTRGRGADLRSWGSRPGMVFANNAVHSERGDALWVGGAGRGVTLCGNVVCGRVRGVDAGFVHGRGLEDFEGAGYDGIERDVRPSRGSTLRGGAAARFTVHDDLTGAMRQAPIAVGCRQP